MWRKILDALRRLHSLQVYALAVSVVSAIAAVVSIPMLQPTPTPQTTTTPQPGGPATEPITPTAAPAPSGDWFFVGTGGIGVPRGFHADFVLRSSIQRIGSNRYRFLLANAFAEPQINNLTLAKAVTVVDCGVMTIAYEEVESFHRDGTSFGTVRPNPETLEAESALPGYFNYGAARFVCDGPSSSDLEVNEEDFYEILNEQFAASR